MILLDAYPIISFLKNERPVSDIVETVLTDATTTSVNAAEAIDKMIRHSNADPDELLADVRTLRLAPIAIDATLAELAALLRARYYHRSRCAVSLADCVAAAVTLHVPAIDALATADPALLSVVHAEGGNVLPLPDSNGNMWTPPA